MSTPDPDELLRQLDPGIAELKAKAEQAQEQLVSSSATKRSPDGAVSVTVGPGGNLTGLELTERAYQQSPTQLAALIMRLSGQAQQQVAAVMMEAFTGLVGPNSPALDVLTPFLPPAPDDQEPEAPQTNPDEAFDQHPSGYGPPVPQQQPGPGPQGPPPPYGQPPFGPPPQQPGGFGPPPAGHQPPPSAPPFGDMQRRPRRRRDDDPDIEPDYDQGDFLT